ncbi:MAG: DEAD/DEAH box helicase [Desulfobulbaceae bacterium]|nr:DEAD/DEAH box helicase [Desulfobulbaceae bacterium]
MANTTARPHQKQNKQTDNDPSSTYIVHGAIFGLDVVKVKKEKRVPARKKKQKPIIKEKVIDTSPWDIAEFDVPQVEGRVRFHDFDIPATIMRGIADLAFKYCTPIQSAILEHTLKGGDATGKAQTGTGKTAAFLITLLTRLMKNERKSHKSASPRALIIGPTRELVIQIAEDCEALSRYTGLNTVAVYGGMDYQKQLDLLLERQVDIVVATPGRLLDFQRQQVVHLGQVEIFVIDEADRMLDMGFIPDVRHIVYSLPAKKKRQTLLFSATLTPEVTHLASQWTENPEIVEIEPEQVTVEAIKEIIYLITVEQKYALLYNLITRQNLKRVIIFCNRRDETRKLTEVLRFCKISCDQLSGDVAQKKRMDTLDKFKSGKIQVLVATDVAGRGIHVDCVSHVINFTLPYDAEDYVHRIGRTGRAGQSGISISFASEEDSFYIPDIEEYIGHKLHCQYPDDEWLKLPESIDLKKLKTSPRKKQGFNKSRSHRRK